MNKLTQRTMNLIVAGAVLVSAVVLMVAWTNRAEAACLMSYCQDGAGESLKITNTRRQIVGDVYDPGHGRPLQIRNNSRQILGYVEADGTIRNTRGQRVLEIKVPLPAD